MELHLHLSAAFRSLDRKWGTPIDLDDENTLTCVPAVVDVPTTTFSSEEFLMTLKREKKIVNGNRKRRCDSFSNISVSRIFSEEYLNVCAYDQSLIYDIDNLTPYEDDAKINSENSINTSSSVTKKWKLKRIMKNLKNNSVQYIAKRFKKESQ
ncbi:unnamed protein product, partial [Brenthis ino]